LAYVGLKLIKRGSIDHDLTPACSIGEELGVDPKVILETSHGRRSIDGTYLKPLIVSRSNTFHRITKESCCSKDMLVLSSMIFFQIILQGAIGANIEVVHSAEVDKP